MEVASRTDLQLKCAPVEKEPVFKGEINCTSHLLWETPHACPRYVSDAMCAVWCDKAPEICCLSLDFVEISFDSFGAYSILSIILMVDIWGA